MENEIRAVLDTNVIVSGLLFGGVPKVIVDAALDRKFTAVSSMPLIKELQLVLSRPKFGLDEHLFRSLLEPYLDVVEIINPSSQVDEIKRCPADNRVLECAIDGESQYIVTGDQRDLVALKKFKGIPIITPKNFISRLI